MSPNLGGTDLKRLHRSWRRRTDGRIALILDGVQGPFNVGGITRSAAAYGVDHIWLAAGAPLLTDAKVQKTALGTQRYLTWEPTASVEEALDLARTRGFHIVGLELAEGAVALHELERSGDICLVVGHEDRGLSRAALEGCDSLAYLPQVGRVGSLNVATATAIALYELRRRTWTTDPTNDPAIDRTKPGPAIDPADHPRIG